MAHGCRDVLIVVGHPWNAPCPWGQCAKSPQESIGTTQGVHAMNFPNPYPTRIPSDSSYNFSFTSNAAYFQRATVSINGQAAAVFTGSGENVAMTQQGGSTSYGGATRQSVSASVLFEYSPDGSNYSQSSVAQAWSTSTLVLVGTEDSNDNDNNDTVMTLSFNPL